MKRLIIGGVVLIAGFGLLLLINPKLQEKSFVICSDRDQGYEQSLSWIRGERLSEIKHEQAFDCGFSGEYTITVKYIQRLR